MQSTFKIDMDISTKLDGLHSSAKQNRWLGYFATFNRVALAAGFLPSGYVKIIGERFTDLHNNQPMGHYLEALHHTGYYYTYIGIAQVTAAVLLLIPRTAILGALLYFPIILNICILSLSVRFEGSLLSSPLMVLANLFLLCWYYDRLKYIFPFYQSKTDMSAPKPKVIDNKFPVKFFFGVVAAISLVVLLVTSYDIMPRNTLQDCMLQCTGDAGPNACKVFCDDIHIKGRPFDKSLDAYHQALKSTGQKK